MKTQRTKPKTPKPSQAKTPQAKTTQADPRLVWLASVLAAAVFVLYVTHV
jgi:hypothetical protein